MVDRRKKLHLEITADNQSGIKGVLRTSIPYLSIIENMGVHRAPVGLFAPKSQAAVLFDQLWAEIVLRAELNSR
jgi:cellulose biosynthesis protein BcsQ